MKKFIYTSFFFVLFSFCSFSQNPSDNGGPGFGDEFGGDAQTNPDQVQAPIDQGLELLLISALFLGAFVSVSYKNKKIMSKN